MKYTVSELKGMARKNRQQFHKELYREMKKSGELEEHLNSAAESTYEALKDYEGKLMKQGGYTKQQAEDTAWEVLRQEWLLLPPDEEEEEPERTLTKEELEMLIID